MPAKGVASVRNVRPMPFACNLSDLSYGTSLRLRRAAQMTTLSLRILVRDGVQESDGQF